jgi:type II secretory pathway component PulC
VIINNAKAKANADIQNNNAQTQSFYNVVTQQSDAYALLKQSLNMNDQQLIKYIKGQAID